MVRAQGRVIAVRACLCYNMSAMELRSHFDERLANIYDELQSMERDVKEQLLDACRLLVNPNGSRADQIIEADKAIDAKEMIIDDKCLRLIATEQPVATDLRKLIGFTKATADLERIGDVARHIARISKKDIPENFAHHIPRIIEVCNSAIDMLDRSIIAMRADDVAAARSIAAEDDQIDQAHRDIRHAIISDMKQDPEHIKNGNVLLELNRMVERFGDYVTTICEWIIFAVEGTHLDLN